VTLPAFTAERQRIPRRSQLAQASTSDISYPQGAEQQTRRPQLLLSFGGTNRLTDKRTLGRYIDLAPYSMWAAPKSSSTVADPGLWEGKLLIILTHSLEGQASWRLTANTFVTPTLG